MRNESALDVFQRKLYLWMMPLSFIKIGIIILFCYGFLVVGDYGINKIQSQFVQVDKADASFLAFVNQFTPDIPGMFKALMFGQLFIILYIIKRKPYWFETSKRRPKGNGGQDRR